jgi:hypothetical protein
MGEPRRKADWPILAAVIAALMLVPLGFYVGGYFFLGETSDVLVMNKADGICHAGIGRRYQSQWLARIYTPAGEVEQFLLRHPVLISHEGLHSYP